MIKFFEKFPEVTAVMSLKNDGNMNINHRGDKSTNNNRSRFFQKAGVAGKKVHSALLKHGTEICVTNKLSPKFISGTDALITSEEEVFLSITVADCYPVLLYDPVGKIVAVIHAGWKGIAGEIIPGTVNRMNKMGSKYKDMRAAVGPGICQRHFEFNGQLFKEHFKKYQSSCYAFNSRKNVYLDLKKIILRQLVGDRKGNLERENVKVFDDCTYCNTKDFYSYRRDKNDPIDAMIVLIGMKHS